jgi:preprotein translocase subunit SecA
MVSPVLVGTTSVEKSEYLSKLLAKAGIRHEVLNAKNNAREAVIVAQAGRFGAVTVATNMAGRGTDIMLGGNAEFLAVQEMQRLKLDPEENQVEYEAKWDGVFESLRGGSSQGGREGLEVGGLYVLGTERHESRRIDNQLRGRSGRQGDPGESRFYLSLTDDLMRLFNSQAAASLMNRASVPDDQAIESKVVSRAIASAQSQVEGRNAEIRKNILKYDDVMNRQREAIYADRLQILEGEDISGTFAAFLDEVIAANVSSYLSDENSADWDLEGLWTQLKAIYPIGLEVSEVLEEAGSRAKVKTDWLIEEILSDARLAYQKRTDEIGEQLMRELERRVMLSVIDRKWRDHLYEMDYLKEGIGLRAMAQRDPLVEYQREGYVMFQDMMAGIREEAVQFLFNVEIKKSVPDIAQEQPQQLTYSAPSEQGGVQVKNQNGEAPKQTRPTPPPQPPKTGGAGSSFFKN